MVVVVDVGESDEEHVVEDIDVGVTSARVKHLNFSIKCFRMCAIRHSRRRCFARRLKHERDTNFWIKSSRLALGGHMRDPMLQAWNSHEDSRIRDSREYGYKFAATNVGEQVALEVIVDVDASEE